MYGRRGGVRAEGVRAQAELMLASVQGGVEAALIMGDGLYTERSLISKYITNKSLLFKKRVTSTGRKKLE